MGLKEDDGRPYVYSSSSVVGCVCILPQECNDIRGASVSVGEQRKTDRKMSAL